MNWRDRQREWTPPTLREVVSGYEMEIQRAARDEGDAIRAVERYQPGDEKLRQARSDVVRHRSDQAHFREQLTYWRGLLARHPELADRPGHDALRAERPMPAEKPAAKVIPLQPHWTEREPGADDLSDLPF